MIICEICLTVFINLEILHITDSKNMSHLHILFINKNIFHDCLNAKIKTF